MVCIKVSALFFWNFAPEYVGSRANPYQIYEAVTTVFIPSLFVSLIMIWGFQDKYYMAPLLNGKGNAQSHPEADPGARDGVLNNGTSLPPQTTEQICSALN